MKKLAFLVPFVLLLFTATLRLHAQVDGCDDSPENPTAVLGCIVGAASLGYTGIRRYLRNRNSSRQK